MNPLHSTTAWLVLIAVTACGPDGRPNGADDGAGAEPDASVSAPESCIDVVDNDGDGRVDCSDPDCSGVDGCPVCGVVENPESQPLALPDGIGLSTSCSTNAQCNDATIPNCVADECHASYTSALDFVGFPAGATLTDPSKLAKVCVNIEHTWLRDLQFELIKPDGGVFILQDFKGRAGGEIYLGNANDADDPSTPVPGIGLQYCWTPTAIEPLLGGPTMDVNGNHVVKPGDYKSSDSWSALTGAQLNGKWEMRVTDLWPGDNGFMFSWSISFDPTLVSDCAGPIIL